MAIIAAVDRADDAGLAQIQLVLESLEAAPSPPVIGG